MYSPKPAPQDPKELSAYLYNELQAIAQAGADTLDSIQLNVLNKAPKKPRAGMVIEADGVNFNPGAGAGCYIYRAGAWVKLG
jgi:hypothetical protein